MSLRKQMRQLSMVKTVEKMEFQVIKRCSIDEEILDFCNKALIEDKAWEEVHHDYNTNT